MTDHQPAQEAFLLANIQRGDLFIDVGACLGQFTFLALDMIGPSGHVIAIEPDPDNCSRLRESNDKYHDIQKYSAEVINKAASDRTGWAGLYTSSQNKKLSSLHKRYDRDRAYIQVETFTIDSLFQANNGFMILNVYSPNRVGMKIDVEGHERAVIAGAEKTLLACSYVTVDFHNAFGVHRDEIRHLLERLGFTVIKSHHPETRNEVYGIRV